MADDDKDATAGAARADGYTPAGPGGLTEKEAKARAKAEDKDQADKLAALKKAAPKSSDGGAEGTDFMQSVTSADGRVHDGSTLHGEVTALSDIRQHHFPVTAEGEPLNARMANAEADAAEAHAKELRERADALKS